MSDYLSGQTVIDDAQMVDITLFLGNKPKVRFLSDAL